MRSERGFTLIELSIVLVIIGLIVGGVLVGQDLIRAAEVRATISQIEKYNTAVNTFRGKYNALPGDMNYSTAVTFGFPLSGRTSPPTAGQGDGNGQIDGGSTGGMNQAWGETGVFWVDLSSSVAGGLVDGGFNTATENTPTGTISTTSLTQYFPAAKLGRGNMIYVYTYGGYNFYSLQTVISISTGGVTTAGVSATLSPAQAYNIDKKMDDGSPNTGNVIAYYANMVVMASSNAAPGVAGQCWDSTGATSGPSGTPPISVLTASAGISGGQGFYLTSLNNGQGAACGLSFKFE